MSTSINTQYKVLNQMGVEVWLDRNNLVFQDQNKQRPPQSQPSTGSGATNLKQSVKFSPRDMAKPSQSAKEREQDAKVQKSTTQRQILLVRPHKASKSLVLCELKPTLQEQDIRARIKFLSGIGNAADRLDNPHIHRNPTGELDLRMTTPSADHFGKRLGAQIRQLGISIVISLGDVPLTDEWVTTLNASAAESDASIKQKAIKWLKGPAADSIQSDPKVKKEFWETMQREISP